MPRRRRRRNIASDIACFWRRVVHEQGIQRAVTVTVKDTPYGPETNVKVKSHVPPLPFFRRQHRYLITSKGRVLRSAWFEEEGPRHAINQAKNKSKGRVLNWIDVETDQELAALSFHIPDEAHWPVRLLALALRTDSDELADRSRVFGGCLLAYLLEVNRATNRPEEIWSDSTQSDQAELEALGFKVEAAPNGCKVSGAHMVFRPPPKRGAPLNSRRP
jgi:hypothetical protein